jgi:hypothetical protein
MMQYQLIQTSYYSPITAQSWTIFWPDFFAGFGLPNGNGQK